MTSEDFKELVRKLVSDYKPYENSIEIDIQLALMSESVGLLDVTKDILSKSLFKKENGGDIEMLAIISKYAPVFTDFKSVAFENIFNYRLLDIDYTNADFLRKLARSGYIEELYNRSYCLNPEQLRQIGMIVGEFLLEYFSNPAKYSWVTVSLLGLMMGCLHRALKPNVPLTTNNPIVSVMDAAFHLGDIVDFYYRYSNQITVLSDLIEDDAVRGFYKLKVALFVAFGKFIGNTDSEATRQIKSISDGAIPDDIKNDDVKLWKLLFSNAISMEKASNPDIF